MTYVLERQNWNLMVTKYKSNNIKAVLLQAIKEKLYGKEAKIKHEDSKNDDCLDDYNKYSVNNAKNGVMTTYTYQQ